MRTDDDYTIGILADDLTSAADGAPPFAARGHQAMIGRREIPLVDSAVVTVDSGSRSMLVPQAAIRVAHLTAQLATRDILYKTVDSTLRGNVSAELEASFKASRRKMLVFAPAFPAAGRTTVSGVQLVDGIPVSETIYGRDPVHPARHSRLIDLVPSSIGRVVILDAATKEELGARIEALPERIPFCGWALQAWRRRWQIGWLLGVLASQPSWPVVTHWLRSEAQIRAVIEL